LNLEVWFRVFLEGEPHDAGMKGLEEGSVVALAAA